MMRVCIFVLLKIVPIFHNMIEEFGLRLPALTRLVISVSNWFVRVGWIPILPITMLIIPSFVIVTVLYYCGWLPRGLPLWWRLSKRYDGAIVMRGLALAIRHGMPIPQALRLVAQSYPLSIVGVRLAAAADEVAAGNEWCQSLRKTDLIADADVAVLHAAQRVGNL